MIDVLYFAWVRERIGLPRERIETSAATVSDLISELCLREARYAAAFADLWRFGSPSIRSCLLTTRRWKGCARWRSSRR